MRKIIMIDGGAGRAIASIPALEKYAKNHANEDWYVLIAGWDNLLWGNKLLQDRTFSMDTKGIFNSLIKDADIILVLNLIANHHILIKKNLLLKLLMKLLMKQMIILI